MRRYGAFSRYHASTSATRVDLTDRTLRQYLAEDMLKIISKMSFSGLLPSSTKLRRISVLVGMQ